MRLLEYKRYKEILEEMRTKEEDRSLKHYRGNSTAELKKIAEKALIDVELESVTLFKLFNSFQKLLQQFEDRGSKTIHTIVRYNYTIEEQRVFIMTSLDDGQQLNFQAVFGKLENRIHAIVTFLSLLELLNQHHVRLVQGEGSNNFWLEKGQSEDHSEEE